MDRTDDMLEFVRTVAGLPRDDQNRLLRLCELISLAPFAVQQRSHARLREIIKADPQSKFECVDGLDDLIEDLERSVGGAEDRSSSWSGLPLSMLRGTTQ